MVMRALRALRPIGSGSGSDEKDGTQHLIDRNPNNRRAAAALWAASRPLGGSPAEAYLRQRGLTLASPDLRYHPRTPCGRGAQALFRPALIAAVRDESGLVAVHRTFVEPGSATLADLPLPKRALGRLGQGAVRLRRPLHGTLGWAEGIETAMAATLLTGIPCWATLGDERFARVSLAPSVKRLILFLDNDAGGRRAEKLAREALRASGVEIEGRRPEAPGADWNDMLLALHHIMS